MVSNFKYITFSIFHVSDFQKVIDVVKDIFKEELEDGKADIYAEIPIINEYINQDSGGNHFPKFSCWQCSAYPDKTFFISNYEDGLPNLCKLIQKYVECNLTMCALSGETEHPMFRFYFSDSHLEERIIQVYKEDKWIFYEKGTPLVIENTNYYKKRFVKERLNNSIIKEYLLKQGVDFFMIDSQITKGYMFRRKKW